MEALLFELAGAAIGFALVFGLPVSAGLRWRQKRKALPIWPFVVAAALGSLSHLARIMSAS